MIFDTHAHIAFRPRRRSSDHQRLVGQSSLGVTSTVYGYMLRQMQRDAVDRLSHLFGPQRNGPQRHKCGQGRFLPGSRACSPSWTRTNNPAINSRMLCQLSYRGKHSAHTAGGLPARTTLAYGPQRPCRRPHLLAESIGEVRPPDRGRACGGSCSVVRSDTYSVLGRAAGPTSNSDADTTGLSIIPQRRLRLG